MGSEPFPHLGTKRSRCGTGRPVKSLQPFIAMPPRDAAHAPIGTASSPATTAVTSISSPSKNNPPMRLFLSYGHDEHLPFALRLKSDLERHNHQVRFDQARLRPAADNRCRRARQVPPAP